MHRVFGRQEDLLRRVRPLRLLFLAAFGSGFGTWLAFVALTLDVWARTHSGTWIAALLLADFLPAIAIGLPGGAARRSALTASRDGRGGCGAVRGLHRAAIRRKRRP